MILAHGLGTDLEFFVCLHNYKGGFWMFNSRAFFLNYVFFMKDIIGS
jgi:hypothetical protein